MSDLLILFCFCHTSVLVIILRRLLKHNTSIYNVGDYPVVSVIIAARNEEGNILNCMQSIAALNYPEDKIEILIGDDDSSDKTAERIKDFCQNHRGFKYIKIISNLNGLQGKTNVLAQLCNQAKGEYFFFTDADMQPEKGWILSLLSSLNYNVKMSGGTSIIKVTGSDWFATLQQLESMFLYGVFHVSSTYKSVTASGNNMAIEAEAYRSAGGFEKLPFSVTEDYVLLRSVIKKGYKYVHILSPASLVYATPEKNIYAILNQRKRWIRGASSSLSVSVWIVSLLYSLFLPVWISLAFINIKYALIALIGKFFFDALIVVRMGRLLHIKTNILYLPLFEVYLQLLNLFIILYSIIPTPVYWKGRKY